MKADFLNYGPQQNDRLALLLRKGAERALSLVAEEDLIIRMEQAGLVSSGEHSGYDDPVLIASIRRAIRGSLIHWLNNTIEKPTAKVPAYITENVINNAVAMSELGLPELMYSIGKSAQNIAWQYWMDVAFEIVEDSNELKMLLDVSFKSITTYIEDSETILQSELKNHSKLYHSRYSAEKRDLVVKLLDGDSSEIRKLLPKLDYSMGNCHHAAIIWCEEGRIDLSTLQRAAKAFIKACGDTGSLIVNVSGEVVWVWCSATESVDRYILSNILNKLSRIRIVYSSGAEGLEGFRKSHMDALSAQRILGRLRSSSSIVSYDQLRLAEIMSKDADAANSFISNTLGKLNDASSDLWNSLLVYIECGCNANQAAQFLHTHRNTLIRRLSRAEELLPKPLADNLIQVASALEVKRWLS